MKKKNKIFMAGHLKLCETSRKAVKKKCPDGCVRVCVLIPRKIQASVHISEIGPPIELIYGMHLKQTRSFLLYHHIRSI